MRRTILCLLCAVAVACGGDDEPTVADQRAAQVQDAATEAGLPADVAGFLALASRGLDATYVAEYPGPEAGTTVLVSSEPPNRRVDIFAGDALRDTRIVRDGVSYECETAGATFTCTRADGFVEAPGVFRESGLDDTITSLAGRLDTHRLEVIERRVLDVDATCLSTASTESGEAGLLCVSPDGVLLLVDEGGERLEATSYATTVPRGVFDLGV